MHSMYKTKKEEKQKTERCRRREIRLEDEDREKRDNDRKKETQELVRAGKRTNRAVRSEKAIKSNC